MVINQTVKYESGNDPLSLIFGALADPTRRSILALLSTRDATVNEIAEPHKLSLPAISKHLKVLERAGLITTTKNAQYRPRHLEVESLKEVTLWLEGYRRLWSDNLNSLEDYLTQVQSEESNNKE